ncbi:hypothetical protein AKJ64_00585 [candidate division MSBL1 archaeon SCGC-AAA259E17]|uniref:Uncharacterized protein n=1 Tax=candidate division MSBL1 archaeon SCGC-AAA259E17 TaxID=1698263 RepID=A0A133UH70_9EURY|nr:hypothetical protein AKJ64_00585 [candidate division MSBL1 archaeon SCGC-AAA259E17]
MKRGRSREDWIAFLASKKTIPTKNPWKDSGLEKSNYILKRVGQEKLGSKRHIFGKGVRKQVIKELGIKSDEECEKVREKIKNHPKWKE